MLVAGSVSNASARQPDCRDLTGSALYTALRGCVHVLRRVLAEDGGQSVPTGPRRTGDLNLPKRVSVGSDRLVAAWVDAAAAAAGSTIKDA